MTRQQHDDEGGGDGDTMHVAAVATPPRYLLLDAREIAREALDSDSTTSVSTSVVAAFGAHRVAVLQVTAHRSVNANANDSSSGSGIVCGSGGSVVPSVRLGIFNTSSTTHLDMSDHTPSISESTLKTQSTRVWTEVWTKDEADLAAQAARESESPCRDELKWSLAWSTDGAYLVISGAVINSNGNPEPRLWVYATREWMAIEDATSPVAIAPRAVSPPLLVQVDPAAHLSGKDVSGAAQIVTVFFHASRSNRLLYVTSDALLVQLDVQVPALALLTLNTHTDTSSAAPAASNKTLFSMKVVKRMGDWHADVATAVFAPSSATLVVSGGIANPSNALVRSRASSLSIWKVLIHEPFCELLDCTMVLSADRDATDTDASALDGSSDEPSSQLLASTDTADAAAVIATPSSSGLLQSVRGSLLSPLQFMIGGAATSARARVLRGSIVQLAVSPDGAYVTMLDSRGRFAVRQIATCSDVLDWQVVDPAAAHVQSVLWASPSVLGCVLASGRTVFGTLAALDTSSEQLNNALAQDPAETRTGATHAVEWIPTQSLHSGFPSVFDRDVRVTAMALAASTAIAPARTMTGDGACVPVLLAGFELAVIDGCSVVSAVVSVEATAFVHALVASRQVDRALDVVASLGEAARAVDLDAIHQQVWTQFRALTTVDDTSDGGYALLATDRTPASTSFAKALDHLQSTRDSHWVVNECVTVVATDSIAHMKELLTAGLLASRADTSVPDATSTRAQQLLLLRQYAYRLDTFQAMVAADAADDDGVENALLGDGTNDGDLDDLSHAAATLFDGAAFARFRTASVVAVAKQLAREARVGALHVLLQRNAWSLEPHRLELLALLPATVSPLKYAHLLPAIGPAPILRADSPQFYTLRPQSSSSSVVLDATAAVPANDDDDDDDSAFVVTAVELTAANRSDDLGAADLDAFERSTQQSAVMRCEALAAWFERRVRALDAVFGQLAHAQQLSALASASLRGWRAVAAAVDEASECDAHAAFTAFQQHVERLYSCSYVLQLPSCTLLSLDDWLALSVHDQMLCVIGADWDDAISGTGTADADTTMTDAVTDAIDRLHAVFVAPRRDARYTLDAALAALCRTLTAQQSLPALALCAQVLHQSNPSRPIAERWLQDDALLLRTAIDVVYVASTSDVGGISSASASDATSSSPPPSQHHHSAFVEQLWTVFQSLPVRKADDPPNIEQLQVEVDAMEDLMVTMDVLSKYGVATSPRALQHELRDASAADDLLQRMCRFALPGDVFDTSVRDTAENGDNDPQQWMELWRDATKLKTHAFGERISHDAILDAILRQLLRHDVYLDAAEHLVTNWISSNVDIVHHAVTLLIRSIQTKLDPLRGHFTAPNDLKSYEVALQCVDITQRVLAHVPPLELERKTQYERQLRHECELVHACQLLDLLTYGAVKLSPAAIRPLKDARVRLDVVLQVFSSNPSHYQVSSRARDWFVRHALEHVLAPSGAQQQQHCEPLGAVMYLAKLLRVDDADQRQQIVLQGAYAALYCGDYDVAYALTTDAVQRLEVAAAAAVATRVGADAANDSDFDPSSSTSRADTQLQRLLSLVLDLVSASSFQSWTKKRALCHRVFSARSVAAARLFAQPLAHRLVAWLHRLDAVDALASELGLNEADVDARRQQQHTAATTMAYGASVEELLLNELALVVDVLQDEAAATTDCAVLLRLLQKGFELATVVLTSATTQLGDDDGDGDGNGGDDDAPMRESVLVSASTVRIVQLVQHMARICVAEAIQSAAAEECDDGDYQEVAVHHQSALNWTTMTTSRADHWRACLELGTSYLLVWSDYAGDTCDLDAFWHETIAPLLASARSDAAVASAPTAAVAATTALPSSSASTASLSLDLVVRHLHHFFTLQVASAVLIDGEGDDGDDTADCTQTLRERRARLETFTRSYDEVKRFVASRDLEPEASPEDSDVFDDVDDTTTRTKSTTTSTKTTARAKCAVFARLATQCQELMLSHRKTQELEHMNAFFNESLDLERFARDAAYREQQILALATTREHFAVAQQFAAKYDIDTVRCLFAYIRHAFLPQPRPISALHRHEQLELAFRSDGGDGGDDILEQALARPFAFAHLLLNADGDSVYDALDGTDHVGILLLLRMVLECSKRIQKVMSASDGDTSDAMSQRPHRSLFPLSKASSDRVTLLFMCLKRLKELDPLPSRPIGCDAAVVDFKRVCAASQCVDLVHAPSASSPVDASAHRHAAVAAALPFLTPKSIKVLTKILQKLHHVTASAVVMVYLSHLLSGIWHEQHAYSNSSNVQLAGDLAAYAYESCTPFLSVLTNDHVLLFHRLLLSGGGDSSESSATLSTSGSSDDEFYGQSVHGITHFHALFTAAKRLEIVSDALQLLQTRFSVWSDASRSEYETSADFALLHATKQRELHVLHCDVLRAAFWFVVDEVKRHALFFAGASVLPSWDECEHHLRNWFSRAMTTAAASSSDTELLELLALLCAHVSSVEVASLLVGLALLAAAPPSLSPAEQDPPAPQPPTESITATLHSIYRRVFVAWASAQLSEDAVRAVTRDWATAAPATHCSVRDAFPALAVVIDALFGSAASPHTQNKRAALSGIVVQLELISSAAVQQLAAARKVTLQHPSDVDPLKCEVAAAVVTEWRDLSRVWDHKRWYAHSAVLSRLVLDSASSPSTTVIAAHERQMYEREAFGLQTKAALEAFVLGQQKATGDALAESLASVFSVPTESVFERFDEVFAAVLPLLESAAAPASMPSVSEMSKTSPTEALQCALTLALANLLALYDATTSRQQQLRGTGTGTGTIVTPKRQTWPEEQRRALAVRVREQFGIDDPDAVDAATIAAADEEARVGSAAATDIDMDSAESSWWATLLLRGYWRDDRARIAWYLTTEAYARIASSRVLETFAVAHWEAKRRVCVELLLASPFRKLHAHHCERLVAFAVTTLDSDSITTDNDSGSDNSRLLELLLLRYDVHTLLRAGLYPSLLQLVTAQRSASDGSLRLWTSSGEYLVCGLVMLREFATAARLACALWRVHPLLWDFENARLTLANYLRALAAPPRIAIAAHNGDDVGAALHHEACSRALRMFQSTVLM